MSNFFKTKKLYQKAIGLVFSLVFLFSPFFSFAAETQTALKSAVLAEIDNPSENSFYIALLWAFDGIFKAIGVVFVFSMKILDFAISGELFEKVFFSKVSLIALTIGWSVVRDFFNLFFILILVFIAISIILNIDKYNDKKLIFKVATAAILVNFSKAIALVIIDISQMAMNFFSQAISLMGNSFVNLLSAKIGVASILNPTFASTTSFLVILIISSIFLFFLTGLILVLAVALVVRLVSFWVLIILSPMAMFGLALPGTAIGGMTKNWMDKMISWAFFGPLMMFFLWLALVVVSAISAGSATVASEISFSGVSGGMETFFNNIFSLVIPYISALYLLYYGFDLSKKTSQGAAQATLNWGGKQINKWGRKSAYGIGMLASGGQLTKAKREGIKNRIENHEGRGSWLTRRLTKKGREGIYRGKVDDASGATGAENAEQREVAEELKRFRESSTNEAELERILNDTNASRYSRIAAATQLGKDGRLNTAARYDNAQAVLGTVRNRVVRGNLDAHLQNRSNMQGRALSSTAPPTSPADAARRLGNGADLATQVSTMSPTEITALSPGALSNATVVAQVVARISGMIGTMRAEEIVKLPGPILTDPMIIPQLAANYGRPGSGLNTSLWSLGRQGTIPTAAATVLRASLII